MEIYKAMGIDYLTVKEVGKKCGITSKMVNTHCGSGRIDGVIKKGNLWLIPSSACKPIDKRKIKKTIEWKVDYGTD